MPEKRLGSRTSKRNPVGIPLPLIYASRDSPKWRPLVTKARYRIAILVIFVAACPLFWDWIPDDSFISMRYAENLAGGHGLVFNPGERVEGYSNPLWTVALAAAVKTGTDLPLFARWLSLLFGVSALAMAISLFDMLATLSGLRSSFTTTAFGILAATSMPLVFFSTSGLETTAAAFFVLSGVYFHVRAESEGLPHLHTASNIAMLVAAFLRPEGIIFLVVNGFALTIRHRTKIPRPASFSLAGAFVVFVAVVAWRTAYYGSPVPNTYFAKPGAGPGHWEPLVIGWRTLTHFFLVSGVAMAIPLSAIAFIRKATRNVTFYLAAICGAQLTFIVFVGGDVLRFDRFFVVVQPLVLALALMGVGHLLSRGSRRVHLLAVTFASLAVLTAVGLNAERVRRAKNKLCYHDFMHATTHRQLGSALRDMLDPGSVILANEVGAIPFVSGLPTIDMIGLTDATIARIIQESYRRFGTTDTTWCGDRIADYAMDRAPALVLLPALRETTLDPDGPPGGLHGIWEGLRRHPALRAGYRLSFVVRIGEEKYLHGFIRNDLTVETTPLKRLRGLPCVDVKTY